MKNSLSALCHRASYAYWQIRHHPLTRDAVGAALFRWLKWQAGSRLVPGPVALSLTERAKLLVSAGMHGATMNIFTGLADFEEMGFVLHYLRASDLFVDVGANVGVFGVLAASTGCTVVLFEPGEQAFEALTENLRLNDFSGRATARRMAVSDQAGTIRFTKALDTLNHVLTTENDMGIDAVSMEATTLDKEFVEKAPNLIKIDVEGFEAAVIRGGARTFTNPDLGAVIMELGNHSRRYGIDPHRTFDSMLEFGFTPASYDPIRRLLQADPRQLNESKSDTLFVRDLTATSERLRTAPTFRVIGRDV